jgi:hypothetical protein
MNDIQRELIDLIQVGFIGINGVKVLVDECDPFDYTQYVENDSWLVSVIKREFRPFALEKIAQHIREEINNDIIALHKIGIKIDKIAVLFDGVPCYDSIYSIRYIKVARKVK